MIGYSQDPRAWQFTRRVTRAVGVDLMGAVVDGWMRRDELEAIVATCGNCGQGLPCADWLTHTVSANDLPQFCPNKAVIEALRP